MATTRIITMHINEGKTIAQCLKNRIDYANNPEKTEAGQFVSSYACAPETADQEFLLCRNAYVANTGRHIEHEVIAYQVRQSFKPGEITPEEANKAGYELASRLLGGDFAFIVATHTNRHHIHNHIIFSSVALDCEHKFKDVIRSWKVVSELSDQICREHSLSVVEDPQKKTVTYDKWLGEQKKTSNRDVVRMIIDSALRMQPDGFDALMQLLEEAGCLIKRSAHISIKPPGGSRFVRMESLGPEYAEASLRAALAGEHVHIPKVPRGKYSAKQIELMINIEAKMREGKSRGYQVWAERHNLEAVSKSMIYLKENHIDSYASLEQMIQSKTETRNALSSRIKNTQARMNEIREQKKAITTYRRTKDIYVQYRESGWSQAFYKEHAKEIEAHKKAQDVYSKAGGNLPTLAELSAEFSQLLEQKQEDIDALKEARAEVSNLWHIKTNLDILTDDDYPGEKSAQRTKEDAR